MLKLIGTFILGVYVGQEYSSQIPNVKYKSLELLTEFKNSEFFSLLTKKK